MGVRVEAGRVAGVTTSSGAEYGADVVVASGGARELSEGLVGREHLPADFLQTHVAPLFTTESVFMLHLGVDYDPSIPQSVSDLCYYYLTYNIDESVRMCQDGVYHEGNDGKQARGREDPGRDAQGLTRDSHQIATATEHGTRPRVLRLTRVAVWCTQETGGRRCAPS
jgi:hypothetical protein